ncbi:hypothetical protein [Bordetella tumulicola]|uniref:hypothetical protein n=1 Tax=Bordetella tumulicola TaxID=1649133 RepID=UPI0039F148C8
MDTLAAFTSKVSYSIRPWVHEMGIGEYRGCVDVIGREGLRTFSFARFCEISRPGRERAEHDAMRLAMQLRDTECSDGKSWILPGQISQRGEEGLLADVPSSLLSPNSSPVSGRRGKRHLRVAA